MKDIDDLRRERAAAATALSDAANAIGEIEDGEAPDEAALTTATATFDAAQVAFDKANSAVGRAEAVEAATAASAGTNADLGNAVATGVATPAQAVNPEDKGIEIGFMVGALANCGGNRDAAVAQLDANGHSGVSAVLSGASAGAGGVTIPTPLAATVIEMLRPRIAVRASGARVIDMPAGELRQARQTGSATASYGAEATAIVESEPTFEEVSKNFNTLRSLVPIGNALIRHSSASMARLVRDDLISVMGARSDIGFLRDNGTGDKPTGVINWCLPANWDDGPIAATATAAEAALRAVVSRVEEANVLMMAGGWIMRAGAKKLACQSA